MIVGNGKSEREHGFLVLFGSGWSLSSRIDWVLVGVKLAGSESAQELSS